MSIDAMPVTTTLSGTMMDAVISDIHGNLEALDAVLDAIRQLGATRIICLGDLVCYGPDSRMRTPLCCFGRRTRRRLGPRDDRPRSNTMDSDNQRTYWMDSQRVSRGV